MKNFNGWTLNEHIFVLYGLNKSSTCGGVLRKKPTMTVQTVGTVIHYE